MKAIEINKYGGSEVLEKVDVAKPVPKENQILVEVQAASLNPFDVKIVSGLYKDMISLQFPFTPGGDFAGVVTKLGEDVSDFSIGEEVYGSSNVLTGGSGSFAQELVANVENVSPKPKSVEFEEAAALVLVGVSAVQALEEHIKLFPGAKILIHGGAGGIGHIAIQLAKAVSAYVATTVSTDDKSFVKELGADEVIDYKTQTFERILKDYDAVYDTVGGETTNKSFAVLKRKGILVSMLGQPQKELAEKYGIIAIGQGTKVTSERLKRLTRYVDDGKIKVRVDKVFPLGKVKEAFDYFEKGSPRGKVVLTRP